MDAEGCCGIGIPVQKFNLQIGRLSFAESPIGRVATYHVVTRVGGSVFDEVRLDVQLGKRAHIAPESVNGPDYLAFIGLPPIQVPTIPITIQVGEKVHALTRTYGNSSPSTRVKDLIDLVIISQRIPNGFPAERLAKDISRIFSERGTHPIPDRLPSPPAIWAVGYRREAKELALPEDLRVAHELAAAMVDPALEILSAKQ